MLSLEDYNAMVIARIVECLNKIRMDYAVAMRTTNAIATGKTLESMEIVEEPTGASLYGRPYFFTIETGRGPNIGGYREKTGRGGGGSKPIGLGKAILEWVKARGLSPDYGILGKRSGSITNKQSSLAFIITRHISKYGTALHIAGARREITELANINEHLQNLRSNIFNDVGIRIQQYFVQNAGPNAKVTSTGFTI